MAKVKAKTKRKRHWFQQDAPRQMAEACKRLQPFFTSLQVAGLTGLKVTHVQKSIATWKAAGLIEVIGEGRRDTSKAPFYLYSITPAFDKHLKYGPASENKAEAGSMKANATLAIQQIKPAPDALILILREFANKIDELTKSIG